MSIVEAFKKTIAFFDEIRNEGIIEDYALIGGLALSAWIRPRTTNDVDIVIAVAKNFTWSDITSIVEARLQKKIVLHKGTQRMHIKEKLSFVAGQIEVDVISAKDFELAAEAIKKSITAEVFGKNVKVVTPEYLILLKLLPLSSQDVIDIKALSKKADMRRLKALAKKHFLLSKLETVIKS